MGDFGEESREKFRLNPPHESKSTQNHALLSKHLFCSSSTHTCTTRGDFAEYSQGTGMATGMV